MASDLKMLSAVEKSKTMPPAEAMEFLYTVVRRETAANNDEVVKEKEQAIQRLGELLSENKMKDGKFFSFGTAGLYCCTKCHTFVFLLDLAALIRFIRPFLNCISKAKSAKLVRNLLDLFLEVDATTDIAVRWKA